MKKVCYVLGAGFSAYAGLPVMANFIDKAKDIYYNDNNYQYNKSIYTALELIKDYSVIKNYLNANVMNIEELLSIAEMQDFSLKKKYSSMIKDFIKGVIEYYENIFFQDFRLPENIMYLMTQHTLNDLYISFILSLFEVLTSIHEYQHNGERCFHITISQNRSNVEYSIISFNYDTILEKTTGLINERGYKKDSKLLRFGRDGFENNTIRYCKLHGSIDNNTIMPPTWAKTFKNNIRKEWTDAHKILQEANDIRIIGFSFPNTDSHISYLFKSALISNNNLKSIDVICLDKEGLIGKKYHDVFCTDKFRFKNDSIENYFAYLYKNRKEYTNHSVNYMGLLEYVHATYINSVE